MKKENKELSINIQITLKDLDWKEITSQLIKVLEERDKLILKSGRETENHTNWEGGMQEKIKRLKQIVIESKKWRQKKTKK